MYTFATVCPLLLPPFSFKTTRLLLYRGDRAMATAHLLEYFSLMMIIVIFVALAIHCFPRFVETLDDNNNDDDDGSRCENKNPAGQP